jgi:epoxyqueuosine reductase QueG
MKTQTTRKLYVCDICGAWHPWNWDGDCRDDANRYGDPQEYAEKLGISEFDLRLFTMQERIDAA